MKNVLYVITGILISLVLSYLFAFAIIDKIIESSGRSPESMMWLVYLIVYPLCIGLGSAVTGYLLRSRIDPNFISYLKHSPGLYVSLPYLFSIVGAPMLAILMAVSIGLNIATSLFGMYIGAKFYKNNINV